MDGINYINPIYILLIIHLLALLIIYNLIFKHIFKNFLKKTLEVFGQNSQCPQCLME